VTPDGLAPAVVQQILARTGGVPLFVEEVARAAGTASEDEDGIPMTLRGSLTAQLDRLGDAKPVAQLASVLGRSFRFDVLEAVSGTVDQAVLRQALQRLSKARFLDVEGPPEAPEAYIFRHILIRDAAYESLLREQRRSRHLRVATVLRERFPQMVAARPELLAQHLAAAGREAEAVAGYEAAARQTMEQTAHVEAAEHCRTALALLDRLPETRERIEAEIRLNVLLAVQLTILRGNAEPGVLQAFERAHAAAERLGETWALFRTLRGLTTYHLVRGNVAAGHAVSRRLMLLVGEKSDPAILIQAHRAHGLALLYLGRFAAARDNFARVINLYDPASHAEQRFEYGSDPFVLARCHLGWIEWFMGHADRAEVESEAAIAVARALDHPHSLAFALGFRACIGQFSGRPGVAWAAAGEMAQIAGTHDFPYWAAWAEILQGWAIARQGDVAGGEHRLREGLRHYTDTGAEVLSPYTFFLLADAIHQERRSEAISLLDQSLDMATAQSILFYHTETLRFKAELLTPSDPQQAAGILQDAAAVAEAQDALAIARRVAADLARLRGSLSAAMPPIEEESGAASPLPSSGE
jgi:tetratricopeptide (TPR) repeat protein